MASLNKCIFIGHLGQDPDTKYLPSGDCVTNISIACTEKWKDKQTGEQKENTEWVRVSFFGKLAEVAAKYLKKGGQVYIEGSLRTRKYTDKDGIEKYATDIKASEMKMLGSREIAPDDPQHSPARQPNGNQQRAGYSPDDFDSLEIPF